MSTTPEGKVKKKVRELLANYSPRYEYWPVPSGYGASSLDCILCYKGWFVSIETKAPGKQPTPRQHLTIGQMQQAGGNVFVVATDEDLKDLKDFLDNVSDVRKP